MLASQFFGPPGCAALRPTRVRCTATARYASGACHRRREGILRRQMPARRGNLDMPAYRGQYESDPALRDGSRIHLRPMQPDGATRLLDLFHRLSPRGLYRFFTVPRLDPVYARYLADIDYINRFALVEGCDGKIIAVARFSRRDFPNRAAAAITVADAGQAKGIGALLLDRLATVARGQRITSFEGQVLTDNRQILKALSRSRVQIMQRAEPGVVNLTVSLAPQAKVRDQPGQNAKATGDHHDQ